MYVFSALKWEEVASDRESVPGFWISGESQSDVSIPARISGLQDKSGPRCMSCLLKANVSDWKVLRISVLHYEAFRVV